MYKELNLLLEKARKGDQASKEEILTKLEGLIINSIKRYYNRLDQYDDLIQEGRLVILEAINSYDPSKGVYFLGYVKTRLKYHYLDYHKKREYSSLNTDSGREDQDELIDLLDSGETSPLDQYLELEELSQLKKSLAKLTARQREVLIYFYYKNMPIKDIGEKLGISYRTVVNTKTRAIERIRETRKLI